MYHPEDNVETGNTSRKPTKGPLVNGVNQLNRDGTPTWRIPYF